MPTSKAPASNTTGGSTSGTTSGTSGTGSTTGACPSWAIDHVIPLACGGCDSIENLQWLKNSIKSCAGTECKDRWERKINCQPRIIDRAVISSRELE